MALAEFKFLPGIDKQQTQVGAERRWVNSDNVRWRYGLPEKVGGWSSLLTDTIVGVGRSQHAFTDLDGNRYVAIGTDKFLLIYYEGQLYDITPFRSNNAGVQTTFTSSTLATNSTTVKTCTITTSTAHALEPGDMVVLDSVTLPGGTGLSASDFEDKLFQVLTVPTSTTFTINSLNQASSVVGTGGSMTVQPYVTVGPAEQTYGYGFGIGEWGGTVSGAVTTTVNNGGVLAAGASSVILTDTSSFPSTADGGGTILIENELITYTTNTTASNTLSGLGRGAQGTSDVEHANGVTATNATDYNGWGAAVSASTVKLEPGLWSLDNFGQVLVATIANGKTFTWDSSIAANFSTRASTTTTNFVTTSAPTAARVSMISPTTRHLILFGTETTTGTPSTQDDMFIAFSDQESLNTFTVTADNSAGTQRLQDGTKIMGAIKAKDNILVWTDTALYTMKFVGAPFTFGFEQVGTNCGLIGKNAVIEIDGVAYWMSPKGFFLFDGTVKSLGCSVEDYVYNDCDTTKGQQITAGVNNLFTEVTWWYPTSGSSFNDRYVVYNYGESVGSRIPGGVWYIGTEARTSWMNAKIYPNPFALKYNSSGTGSFPTDIGESGLGSSTYFEQEKGTDQVNADGSTTTVTSNLESYDFDLDLQGNGEYFLSIRRFLPDFKTLVGTATFSLNLKNFPASSASTSTYSPFSITSSSTKFDTRARARFASIKIQNISAGEEWRYGTLRLDVQPDGRR